jgi:hypothetical protein
MGRVAGRRYRGPWSGLRAGRDIRLDARGNALKPGRNGESLDACTHLERCGIDAARATQGLLHDVKAFRHDLGRLECSMIPGNPHEACMDGPRAAHGIGKESWVHCA